jgi:hypothetical protein
MSKFLLNLLLQISKAQPTLRPTWPLSPASPLATLFPAGRKRPAGPSSPRVGRDFGGNTFSFSDHAFPSRPPPPAVIAMQAPLVSFIVSPAPLPRALDAPELLQLSLITSPS